MSLNYGINSFILAKAFQAGMLKMGVHMKCPYCDGKIKVDYLKCLECGRSLSDLDLVSLKLKSDASRKKLLTLIIVISCLILGILVAKVALDKRQQTEIRQELANQAAEQMMLDAENARLERERIEKERADYSWVPQGYNKFYLNPNVAYKKTSYEAADCYQDWCFGMIVVSKEYCRSLRVEANLLKNGVLVDDASDYKTNVGASQKVIMKLGSGRNWDETQWTRIDCT
jgi:hypothetical protein